MSYPAPTPHDPIEEIAPDVFMVRGSVRMNPMMRITRNMAILRHGDELTLINPLRLQADEEQKLRAMGTVTRLLRLGPMHGMDDPYYRETFSVPLLAPGTSATYPDVPIDQTLLPGDPLPFPNAELIRFEGALQEEAALLVRTGRGLLLTCDAIQHYGDYRHNTLLARMMMPFIGFPKTTIIGPIWLRVMTPDGGTLEPAFRKLLEADFDQLLSAHGSFLETGAHAAVTAAVDKAFGT